jgi:LDH2 family malate/lactate/ureidoglycolate dehydrogenase
VTRWGGNVFVQVFDPEAFAGAEAFAREVGALNAACRANPPVPGGPAVRIPGDRAAEAVRRSQAAGVRVPAEVWTRVAASAAEQGVPLPEPLPS